MSDENTLFLIQFCQDFHKYIAQCVCKTETDVAANIDSENKGA